MQTPRDILGDLWTSVGGEASALDRVTLSGDEPQLPSSFRVAAAAQTGIAASAMAAANIWRLRNGQAQDIAVDMRHAVVECRSDPMAWAAVWKRLEVNPPNWGTDGIQGCLEAGVVVLKGADGQVLAMAWDGRRWLRRPPQHDYRQHCEASYHYIPHSSIAPSSTSLYKHVRLYFSSVSWGWV